MNGTNPLGSLQPYIDTTRVAERKIDNHSVEQEFESVLVSMMVKHMRSAMSEEGLFEGDESDSLGGIFDLYMGQHIADSGGLGLAKYLEQVSSQSDGTANETELLTND